jgi:hypothetical protein
MATRPESQPDTIDPQSPSEVPALPVDPQPDSPPAEAPDVSPDIDQPGRGPDEAPPQP